MKSKKAKTKERICKGGASTGFTLIEIMVAMSIFVLIIGGITLFSIRTIEASMRSRAMQNSLENARTSIETLSKQLRTSYFIRVSNDGKNLFFIDNRNFDKYCYEFDEVDNVLRVKKQSFVYESNSTDIETRFGGEEYLNTMGCGDFSGGSVIIGDEDQDKTRRIKVGGFFNAKPTVVEVTTEDDFRRGFVQIVINLEYVSDSSPGSPLENSSLAIQSGVSLRDYGVPGVEPKRLFADGVVPPLN